LKSGTALIEIYREGNQRYIAIKYSVRGRDLGSAVDEAIKKVSAQVQLPRGLIGKASTKARNVPKNGSSSLYL
jgi:Cu/Ag efflux pump CusA